VIAMLPEKLQKAIDNCRQEMERLNSIKNNEVVKSENIQQKESAVIMMIRYLLNQRNSFRR